VPSFIYFARMAKNPPPQQQQQQAGPSEPLYPQIEVFIERAGSGDIKALFEPLKESLTGLKGPRAENAKKAIKGVTRTQELLSHLLEVREKLQAERK
jgi:hypothetical protein